MKVQQTTSNKAEDLCEEGYIFPTSFAQRRLWFIDQFQPGLTLYNIPLALRLDGALDHDALEYAFNEIVRRHESLRTTFQVLDGEPMQVIAPFHSSALSTVDLSEMAEVDRTRTITRLIREESQQPFDLAQGPLFRVKLLRQASDQHFLLITMHHIISDGWSMGIFRQELSELYRSHRHATPSPLTELPIQYADFTVWQRDWLQGDVLDAQLNYWKRQLADLKTLELPLDRPRPATLGYRGAQYPVRLSPSLSDAVKRIGRQEGATLFMTLLALFQVLLSRFSGSHDIAVGTPIAGRNRAEIEPLIGFFVNTLVLRADLSGNPSFREALKRVKDACFDAYDHQDLPFERLVEGLLAPRDLSRHPLFQVMFVLQNTPDRPLDLDGLTVQPINSPSDIAKFDLTFFLRDSEDGLSGAFEYSTDLFDASSIARMADSFLVLAENATSEPDRPIDQLECLPADTRRQLLVNWNDTAAPYPLESCIHELFAEQARRSPDAVALIFAGRHISYDELNCRANQLAHHLLTLGVGPDVPVGVYLERTPEMVVAVLAVLKAGGAYLPLDPAYPQKRIRFMLEDAAAPVVITSEDLLDHLPAGAGHIVCMERDQVIFERQPVNNPANRTNPDHLANIIYTSGSTGVPKGVEVRHRGVTRLVFGNDYAHFGSDEVFLQMAPMSFDASTFELWGALLHGGACVIYPERVPSTAMLAEVLSRHGVTTLWLTASLFNAVIDEASDILTGVRQLLTGGEALSVAHVKKALDLLPNTRLVNGYGPTESTTFACCYAIPRPMGPNLSSVPIGRPIGNTRVYLLNAGMEPVPVGVAGELYIGGDGLARGYLNRPELTAERFVPDPFSSEPGARLYRTGDLARYLPDGNIEFLSRIDEQIKIRGFRIEPGEIEAVLIQHAAVREVVVLARKDKPGDIRLVAYIVSELEQTSSVGELRGYLKQKLPDYMVPSAFVLLDVLPLTPNGKIDRRALPVPDQAQADSKTSFLAPRTPLEIQLTKIWEKELGIQAVGIKDNFFHLGGHSLLAIRVIAQIKKYSGKEIAVADLFKYPTIEQLAKMIESTGWSSPYSLIIPFQPLGSKPPFFCIHGTAGKAANLIGSDQPFYGGIPHGLLVDRIPATVEEMAADYVKEIRILQPEGPYFVGGYSIGGLLAFEIAHQLKSQGQEVGLLALIDPTSMENQEKKQDKDLQHVQERNRLSSIKSYTMRVGKHFMAKSPKEKIKYIISGVEGKIKEYSCRFCLSTSIPIPKNLKDFYRDLEFIRAARKYPHKKFDGPAVLFKVENNGNSAKAFWQKRIEGDLDVYDLPPCHHLDIFEMPQVEVLAQKLKTCLERAQNQTESN
jgi:amino acid adenylation domain-containing protein